MFAARYRLRGGSTDGRVFDGPHFEFSSVVHSLISDAQGLSPQESGSKKIAGSSEWESVGSIGGCAIDGHRSPIEQTIETGISNKLTM